MNNPKTLRIVAGFLTLALLVTMAFLIYARYQNSMWVMQLDGLARFAGSTSAKNDFQAGKLRLFAFSGERDADTFSGNERWPIRDLVFPIFPARPALSAYSLFQGADG